LWAFWNYHRTNVTSAIESLLDSLLVFRVHFGDYLTASAALAIDSLLESLLVFCVHFCDYLKVNVALAIDSSDRLLMFCELFWHDLLANVNRFFT